MTSLPRKIGMKEIARRGIWGLFGLLLLSPFAHAEDTIEVGVLHSLSGTMAISETTLKDTVLMMVGDINKKGGLLGKKVEGCPSKANSYKFVKRSICSGFSPI